MVLRNWAVEHNIAMLLSFSLLYIVMSVSEMVRLNFQEERDIKGYQVASYI